ncbi:alpha-L-rhamnosidase C-terminal domain-containing protein, partial [Flavihumibacter sp. CACIAM 22H1]|uniref:alpha-L-rhamnosidase-related protein n=1 Tax=Flavihumibacter sp. CACIAM 22H1 TaxID=1812911 RepID=UPI000AB69782
LCMSDMFFDSPMHQEPNACTGDYYIEALNAYYAFGDAWLTRQNIIQTAQQLRKNDSRMFHTSYSLIWIQMVQQYIMYTGDAGVLPEILPVADELADLFNTYLNKEYLVANAPNYMFMDWIKIDRFSAHHPPAMIGTGYMTAFYYKALRELAWLHSWAGKKGINYASATKASRYTKLADNIRNGIEKNLWDPAKGLYRDGIAGMSTSSPSFWLPADTAIETHSAHFNTLVVLYDIAPKERQADLLHYVVTQESYELQPYFMSYVLAAFTQLGKTTEGLLQVNRWINGIDTSTYTLKENWQDVSATGYRGDYSHAWGGAALWFCSRNLLGVSSYTPGYQQIALHPYDGATITWAKGTVPVGNNEVVEVDWKKEPAKLWWKYKLPLHRTAIVLLPESWRTKKIRVNGKPVKYQPRLTLATNTILLEVQ